jgi:hypothetical protein
MVTAIDVPVEAEEMPLDTARALTDQIRDQSESLWELIKIAYTHRAWAALGYDSWDAYVEAEFRGSLALPREDRAEVIMSLRDAGLSIRAIVSATGTSIGTVHRDLDDADDDPVDVDTEEPEPEPATITGTDGRNYRARRPRPGGGTKTPQPETRSTIDMLAVARPDRTAGAMFDHADSGIGYGDTDFGACVFMGSVQWFSAGSYDEITPGQARVLAACLLAAAESAEMLAQEGVA